LVVQPMQERADVFVARFCGVMARHAAAVGLLGR
jgi:hypothetical protein